VTFSARSRTATLTALAAAAALSLTACGGGGAGDQAEKDSKGGKDTRQVKTFKGTVSVPKNPERVVVLDTGELDSAITLGVKPVGATKADVSKALPGYFPKDKVEGIQNVGNIGAPNMEKIASLKPDLILTSAMRDAKNYQQLKAIAPTVMTEATGYPWKENFQVHAEALGKKAEGEKAVADYDKHAAEVTKALGGKDKAKSIDTNVVRFMEGADARLYGDKSYIGTVLKDVGLGRPEVVKKAKESNGLFLGVSPEKVDQADAGALFHSSYGDPAKSGYTKASKSGLWKNLEAVKDKKEFAVNDDRWFLGIGYTSANQILDDIEKNLAG
jgi:iron complex transport system substrate-binding protein